MLVKRNFNPIKVWQYIRRPMYFAILWSTSVWFLFHILQLHQLAINFTPIGVLGSALAIFVAFRNNAAYGRWWEARKIWGGVVNSSRVLARLIITFADSHTHLENYDSQKSEAFKRSMVLHCIAWAHALRLHLRQQDHWEEIRPMLLSSTYQELLKSHNKPNYLHLLMGKKVYEAMANGTLGGFDSFQIEGQLLALANYQGAAERIKNTPLPRQYDFFTRMFVLLFTLLLPFGLAALFTTPSLSWMMVPVSILISCVFIIMERTGAANEDPFENSITDVPMSSLSNAIERDLKEMIGHSELPEKAVPIDGYLF